MSYYWGEKGNVASVIVRVGQLHYEWAEYYIHSIFTKKRS